MRIDLIVQVCRIFDTVKIKLKNKNLQEEKHCEFTFFFDTEYSLSVFIERTNEKKIVLLPFD